MISKVQRYFLEIKDFSKSIELNIPKNYKIILDDKKNFELNKFFYKLVGKKHQWVDRLIWTDEQWFKYISNEKVKKELNIIIKFYTNQNWSIILMEIMQNLKLKRI